MKERIESIQVLRGLAALLVVVAHSIRELERQLARLEIEFISLDPIASFGAIGVDIFFIISGFIMMHIGSDLFGRSDKRFGFLKRRIIRVTPLYWLFTFILLALLLLKNRLTHSSALQFGNVFNFDIIYFFKSLLYIPSFNVNGKLFPLLGVGWTLMYEMFFYVIFALLMPFNKSTFYKYITIIFMTPLIIRMFSQADLNAVTLFYSNPIVLEFLFGCFIYECYLNDLHKKINKKASAILLLATVALAYYNTQFDSGNMGTWRFLYWGLPSAVIVFLTISFFEEFRLPKLLTMLGDSSYSLYLSHMVISVPLCVKFLAFIGVFTVVNYYVILALLIAVSLFLGHLTYKYIEQRLNTLFRPKVFKPELKINRYSNS
ncbi:MAG: acyltransferase [Lentisphaeraceae bacterium]|nr:acyltransferase [Lentisphaeraceae bacterium]